MGLDFCFCCCVRSVFFVFRTFVLINMFLVCCLPCLFGMCFFV